MLEEQHRMRAAQLRAKVHGRGRCVSVYLVTHSAGIDMSDAFPKGGKIKLRQLSIISSQLLSNYCFTTIFRVWQITIQLLPSRHRILSLRYKLCHRSHVRATDLIVTSPPKGLCMRIKTTQT